MALLGAAFFVSALIGAVGVYLLPTIIGLARKHPREAQIAALNVFLGWTVLGWIGALVIAMKRSPDPSSSGSGVQQSHAEIQSARPLREFTQRDRTYRAFIESDVIDRALVVGGGDYRKRWLLVADKAGVLDRYIDDRSTWTAVCRTRSWHGLTALTSIPWLAYRKVRYWWAIAIAIFFVIELSTIVPEKIGNMIAEVLILAILLLFGAFADGWLLATLARERSIGSERIITHRSPGNVVLLIVGVVAADILARFFLPFPR
jgi:hypothetical protein